MVASEDSVSAGSERLVRALPWAILVVGLLFSLQASIQLFGQEPAAYGGDGWNYLAAGERLNDGHPLYALSPGDRPVPIVPPYWTVPLLSPPPVAVLWRALAPIGTTAIYLWWLGGVVAIGGFVFWMLWRASMVANVGLLILSPALFLTAISGNANAYLVPLLAFAWIRRDRPSLSGFAVALSSAIKVVPVLLLPWVISRRGGRGFLVTGAGLFVLAVVGAGPGSWLDWWTGVRGAAPSPMSLASQFGVAQFVIAGAAAVASAGLWIRFRANDAVLFSGGLVLVVLATPAFYFEALALLAPCLVVLPPRARPRSLVTAGQA
jgi:hypothetical protein